MMWAKQHNIVGEVFRVQRHVSQDDSFAGQVAGDLQMVDHVAVRQETLDVPGLTSRVASPAAGAIATFLGVTRDNFQGKTVTRLEYEGYTPMAEKVMTNICTEIRGKWDVLSIAMEHRLGSCPVGEASVAIAVSSAHRREALEATQFAIDAIKANVPIWKKEFYADGKCYDEKQDGRHCCWKSNSEWHGGDEGISRQLLALPMEVGEKRRV